MSDIDDQTARVPCIHCGRMVECLAEDCFLHRGKTVTYCGCDIEPIRQREYEEEPDFEVIDPEDYMEAEFELWLEEYAHREGEIIRLEGEALEQADYWGEDLYGPPGNRR